MLDLKVKRSSVIRSMEKKAFNDEVKKEDTVQIMHKNPFPQEATATRPASMSYSFTAKLKTGTKTRIVTLPGRVLFSAQVLKENAEGALEDVIENYETLYEAAGDESGDNLDLVAFENFKVNKVDSVEETRPAILAKLKTKFPATTKHFMYNLRDYVGYAAELQRVDGDFAKMKFDDIYETGPTAGASPMKAIFIERVRS